MFLPLKSPLNFPSKCFERRERKECKESKLPAMPSTILCFLSLPSCPELQLKDPVHSTMPCWYWITWSLCLFLALYLLLLLFFLVQSKWLLGLSLRPPLTQTHFPSFSVCAKWGPCTLLQVHPLHCRPSRLLLKVLSFNHFFKKDFFPGQYEVTDHIRAAFRLSDHLIKPRSIFAAALFRPPFLPGAQG